MQLGDLAALAQKLKTLPSVEWCKCPMPTAADFTLFEARTGVSVPEDVRTWLSLCTGAECETVILLGICPRQAFLDMECVYVVHPGWARRGWLPVASDGCGNAYVIATKPDYGQGHPAFFVDCMKSPSKPTYIVASDIRHFVWGILECELGDDRWPFDRDFVVAADPAILTFSGLPLPWEVS